MHLYTYPKALESSTEYTANQNAIVRVMRAYWRNHDIDHAFRSAEAYANSALFVAEELGEKEWFDNLLSDLGLSDW